MTTTYSGNPANSLVDRVRFILGETDVDYTYITDEEIEYTLSVSQQDPDLAAISCCRSIVAKLAREVNYKIGPESVSASERYKQYRELLQQLVNTKFNAMAAPTADLDSLTTVFDIGMHDHR